MADIKISALTQVPAASGLDELAVNESGVSKKVNITQLATFLNTSPDFTGVPTAPTASAGTNTTQIATTAFAQSGGPVSVKFLNADETPNAQTAMVRVSGMDVSGVASGTYVFEYYIVAQAAGTTQSFKFAVNHTGTTTVFIYNLYFPSAGVTAATGAIDQDNNPTTGSVWAFHATRTKNATLGPQTGVDTLNANIMLRVTGMMIVTVSGTLELYEGCELGGINTTIKAGTCLILTKTG